MATINNKTNRSFVVHGLGLLEPGSNKIEASQVKAYEELTGRKLSSLESDTLEVKTASTKKEDT